MSSVDDHILQPMPSGGYSTNVRIALYVNGRRLRVAKMGPNRLYLDAPHTLPERTGEVVMHIDGHERRWHVTLRPNGQPSRIIEAEFSPS